MDRVRSDAGQLSRSCRSADSRDRAFDLSTVRGIYDDRGRIAVSGDLPAVFVGYFIWHHKYYSAAIVLFWVGQSIINVWVYAADAVVMQLVLTSGFTGTEGSFHDWNYLLTQTGLIHSTKTVASIIRLAGTLVIITAGIFSIYYSFFPAPADFDPDL